MEDPSLGDLVCLHLEDSGDGQERAPAPRAQTAAGIGDALEIEDDAVARIRLMDSLDSLVEEGLVETAEREVEGLGEPRTVYTPTGQGRERAAVVRERYAAETVVVTDGSPEGEARGEVVLSEVGEYVEEGQDPMVTALARLRRDRPLVPRRPDGPQFVGREGPLSTVVEALARSIEQGGRTIVVAGDAGMGKTALVREAAGRVSEEHEGLQVARGACRFDATVPYAPLRQAFASIPEGGPLVDRLAAAGEGATPEDAEAVRAQRRALFNDVADALREVANGRPVVVFLDNLQWADDVTLALFAHLATTVTEWLYPVAFVGAYRQPPTAGDDEHPLPPVLERLERETNYLELQLEPLTEAETRSLVSRVVGRHDLPDAFVAAVHEQTGGVPLLVTQTVSHLLEEGSVDPAEGTYPTNGDAFGVPVAVIDQVDRRLDALDDASRDLVRVAAVLGEHVDGAVLAAASDLPAPRRREYVDLLVAGRIFERVPGTGRSGGEDVRFVSGLFREAVLESLPEGDVDRYHDRVADALLAVHGGDAGERASEIAYHLERAGRVDRSVTFYRRAGAHATATYANEEAVENYRRALDVGGARGSPDATTRAAIARELADVHATVGAFERAIDAVEEGLALAPADSRVACELLGVRADVENSRGELDAAEATATRMRDLAAEVDARDLESAALRKLGNVARKRDEYDRAETVDRESLEIAREIGDSAGEARALVNLGVVASMRRDLETARDRYDESLAIKRALGDRQGEARVLGNLGIVEMRTGDLAAAREYHEESLAAFREVGDRHGAARTLGNLGVVARRQSDFEAATSYNREARDVFREVGDALGEARALANLGTLAYRRGDHESGEQYLRESIAIKREVGDRRGLARSLNNLGFVLSETGSFAAAREQSRESLAVFRDIGEPGGRARSEKNLGRYAVLEGEFDVAREHLESSLATARDVSDRAVEGFALKYLGRIAHETGDHDVAAERYRDARAALADASEHHAGAKVRHYQGTLALTHGDLAAAREHLAASLTEFEAVDDDQFVALCRGFLGLVDVRGGHRGRGRAAVSSALETLREIGATPHLLRLRRHHVETERAVGALEAARDCCRDATADLERAGDGHQAERIGSLCRDLESTP